MAFDLMTTACSAVLYQVSYKASWELVTLRVCNMPVDGGEYKCMYERSYMEYGIYLFNTSSFKGVE